MEMEEVFVARTAWEGAMEARREKSSNFREGISGTASMTKSASWRASREVVGRRRALAASAWD